MGVFVCRKMSRFRDYIKEIERLTSYLNTYLKEGFSIKAVQREQRRMFLFFKRDAFIIFLEKKFNLID